MKKIRNIIIIMLTFALMAVPMDANGASKSSVGKVTGVSVKRSAGSEVTIKWKKASGAKKYVIYRKTNSGSFKRIKTTTQKSYKDTKVKIGNSYSYKIRAYKVKNGKKIYGKYSSVKKIKLTKYDYLVKAYTSYNKWGYESYKDADAIKMGGTNYFNSFIMHGGESYGSVASHVSFNIMGKYKTLEFTLGEVDDWSDRGKPHKVTIYGDGELLKTISIDKIKSPIKYTIPVKGVYELEIHHKSDSVYYKVAFGSVKLYY